MATGFSDLQEAACLDDLFRVPRSGTPRSLYLYLFNTSTPGVSASSVMADDGTRGASLGAVTGGSFTKLTVSTADFSQATATMGAPTTKSSITTLAWTAVTTGFGELCWWALSTWDGTGGFTNANWDTNKALMVAHGPITDNAGAATTVPVAAGETFQFDSTAPLRFQAGDPGDSFA